MSSKTGEEATVINACTLLGLSSAIRLATNPPNDHPSQMAFFQVPVKKQYQPSL